MVWNEEEAQKSYLFSDLKPTNTTINFGELICQIWEHKIRNQQGNQQGDKPAVCTH